MTLDMRGVIFKLLNYSLLRRGVRVNHFSHTVYSLHIKHPIPYTLMDMHPLVIILINVYSTWLLFTHHSSGWLSRPAQHSVTLHPATAITSWCRSPTTAPAWGPSPAWSRCHSQSSSQMSPPTNGPHHMELHNVHGVWDRKKIESIGIWSVHCYKSHSGK